MSQKKPEAEQKTFQKSSTLNKKNMLWIFGIAILLLAVGLSYAWLHLSLTGQKSNKIIAGTLELTLDESTSNGVSIENAVPVYDSIGMESNAYTFSLENVGNVPSVYTIFLDDIALEGSEARVDDSILRYSLSINGSTPAMKQLKTTHKTGYTLPSGVTGPVRVLDSGTIQPGAANKKNYEFHLWVGENATRENVATSNGTTKVFRARIRVYATQTGIE